MPKIRTHKGLKKRIKISATGKVMRHRPGTSHLAPGKTQKRIRRLRKSALVHTTDLNRIRKYVYVIRKGK